GSAFRVYTSPGSAKVRHLRAAPGASLNFNCSPEGEDVAVVLGTAEVVDDPGPPSADAGYMARYAARLPGIGFTPAEFDASYRVLLRIVPERSWELWAPGQADAKIANRKSRTDATIPSPTRPMWIQLETQAYLVSRRNRSTSYFSDIAMTANTRPTMLVRRPQRRKVTSETTSAPITLPFPASTYGEVARYGGTHGR